VVTRQSAEVYLADLTRGPRRRAEGRPPLVARGSVGTGAGEDVLRGPLSRSEVAGRAARARLRARVRALTLHPVARGGWLISSVRAHPRLSRVRDCLHASGSPFLRPRAQRLQRSERGGPSCPHRNPPDRRPPSSTPPSSWPSRLARTVARPWSRFVANSTSSRSRRSPRSSTAWNCKPTACATLRGTDAINRLLKLTDVEGLLVLVDDPEDLVPPPLTH